MEKQPYQVMWIKDGKVVYLSAWFMAKDADTAKLIALNDTALRDTEREWDEEVRVLCRPFC